MVAASFMGTRARWGIDRVRGGDHRVPRRTDSPTSASSNTVAVAVSHRVSVCSRADGGHGAESPGFGGRVCRVLERAACERWSGCARRGHRIDGTGCVEQLGFSDQPAWSTIKVPLVIASMRQRNADHPTTEMVAAISESDNAAAELIWEGLGDPATAAVAVGKVLHDAGDPTTVESRKLRPEYTAFGQTTWSLSNQSRFLSVAACDARDKPVLDLMGQVTNDQRWGVGSFPDTKIKGGWGPSPSGRYLVRQIGVLPTPTGLTVVAMAAEPDSGTFADGTRVLTQIGEWLHDRLYALPAAKCPG